MSLGLDLAASTAVHHSQTVDGPRRRLVEPAVFALAILTVLVRLPLLGRPETADEGGLLLLAGQWGPGRSLYGDYWVDRPPLLVAFFWLAGRLGGAGDEVVALRGLGLLLVAGSVLCAGRLARHAVGTAAAALAPAGVAGVAAVLLCQPRLGTFQIDAELVATPLVLAGLTLALAAVRAETQASAIRRLLTSGACAAAAVLVKQNEIDVLVFLLALVPTLRRRSVLPVRHALAAVCIGAASTTGVVLALAASRGTRISGLWEAVVGFRFAASHVIATQASAATAERLHGVLLSAVLAGLPLLLVRWVAALSHPLRDDALDLRLPVAALVAWESISVLGGGSYWLHYLICLVPGLVLAEAHLLGRRGRTRGRAPVLAALSILLAWPLTKAYVDAAAGAEPDPTVAWLADHARPGDTAVVAFGRADILHATGLTSPYSELWSLPVRVRDPQLHRLARVLASARRPDWIITGPSGDLSGWGIDDVAAELPFRAGYREVADLGETRVFRLRGDSLRRPEVG